MDNQSEQRVNTSNNSSSNLAERQANRTVNTPPTPLNPFTEVKPQPGAKMTDQQLKDLNAPQ